jgi:hypothetical protein
MTGGYLYIIFISCTQDCDAYWYAKNEKAKTILIRLTDWMMNEVSGLSDEQIQDMLRSEHGGLNEVFADVYEITHNQKYLKLAHRFSHQTILTPLLSGEDKLTGLHANTQIPKVIGTSVLPILKTIRPGVMPLIFSGITLQRKDLQLLEVTVSVSILTLSMISAA